MPDDKDEHIDRWCHVWTYLDPRLISTVWLALVLRSRLQTYIRLI